MDKKNEGKRCGNEQDCKGQAALEFLTTYAWVFLMIIGVIGALSYFGLLSPQNLLPDKCSISSDFECLDHAIQSDTTDPSKNRVLLRLRNNVGEKITLNISALAENTPTPLSCLGDNSTLNSSQVWNANLSNCNFQSLGIVEGEKEKIRFRVVYHTITSGSDYPHEVQGELYAKVI
jgi:hypothetical protein